VNPIAWEYRALAKAFTNAATAMIKIILADWVTYLYLALAAFAAIAALYGRKRTYGPPCANGRVYRHEPADAGVVSPGTWEHREGPAREFHSSRTRSK
jgi:hypothetical protein